MAATEETREARERILEAACDLIASDGIDDVRIARVATRARVSTALVHHYFSTREELLEMALRHSFETAGEERFAGAPDPAADPARALGLAIEACLPYPGAQERDWTLWVELWLRAARSPELRPLAADLYERYRDWLAGFIAAGLESGDFRSSKPASELADYTIALLDGLGVRALVRNPALAVDRARELVAAGLAAELGIEPASLLAKS